MLSAPAILATVKRTTITIIGPGRLGSALAQALCRANYEIGEVVHGTSARSRAAGKRLARSSGARATTLAGMRLDADVIWFCVPDDSIARVAGELAGKDWRGKIAFHSSGVLASDVLSPLRRRGARVASLHPLMTFVHDSSPLLEGVPFGLEGDVAALRSARAIVHDIGGADFAITRRHKTAYHAFATMICPLLISLLAASETIAKSAGIFAREARIRMMPIVRQTIANYARLGAAESFSGPIARGDVDTIANHLRALGGEREVKRVYSALVLSALELLPNKNRKQITDLLARQVPATRHSGKGKGPGRRRPARPR